MPDRRRIRQATKDRAVRHTVHRMVRIGAAVMGDQHLFWTGRNVRAAIKTETVALQMIRSSFGPRWLIAPALPSPRPLTSSAQLDGAGQIAPGVGVGQEMKRCLSKSRPIRPHSRIECVFLVF